MFPTRKMASSQSFRKKAFGRKSAPSSLAAVEIGSLVAAAAAPLLQSLVNGKLVAKSLHSSLLSPLLPPFAGRQEMESPPNGRSCCIASQPLALLFKRPRHPSCHSLVNLCRIRFKKCGKTIIYPSQRFILSTEKKKRPCPLFYQIPLTMPGSPSGVQTETRKYIPTTSQKMSRVSVIRQYSYAVISQIIILNCVSLVFKKRTQVT